MHFKIKGGCQTLPRIFFVCFLDLRNNNIEMQRLENGRLHTHTYAHVQQQKKIEGAVYFIYFSNCNAFKNECVYICMYKVQG